jgi:hypothetical protein
MYNDNNELLATCEMLFLCYNLVEKRVKNFSQMMSTSLSQLDQQQKELPWPDTAGKGIALKRS